MVRTCGRERLAVQWWDGTDGTQWTETFSASECGLPHGFDADAHEVMGAIGDIMDRKQALMDHDDPRGVDWYQVEPIMYRLDGGEWKATPLRWKEAV